MEGVGELGVLAIVAEGLPDRFAGAGDDVALGLSIHREALAGVVEGEPPEAAVGGAVAGDPVAVGPAASGEQGLGADVGLDAWSEPALEAAVRGLVGDHERRVFEVAGGGGDDAVKARRHADGHGDVDEEQVVSATAAGGDVPLVELGEGGDGGQERTSGERSSHGVSSGAGVKR